MSPNLKLSISESLILSVKLALILMIHVFSVSKNQYSIALPYLSICFHTFVSFLESYACFP
jgi:hypothetical protein